jgi:SET domain-containing protein
LNNTNNSLYINTLNEKNLSTINKLKLLTNEGYFYGLSIFYDDVKGHGVKASMNINPYTLIGEYSGKVLIYRSIINDNLNDYYFTLLDSGISNTSLVVDASVFGNITKFINSAKQEYNCSSVLLNIENKAHIFYYTTKLILKGQELVIDYNGGNINNNKYDTKSFI